eukprot:COSAG06_NODE_2665_length_6474_cov_19.662745_1_plen_184_part_10
MFFPLRVRIAVADGRMPRAGGWASWCCLCYWSGSCTCKFPQAAKAGCVRRRLVERHLLAPRCRGLCDAYMHRRSQRRRPTAIMLYSAAYSFFGSRPLTATPAGSTLSPLLPWICLSPTTKTNTEEEARYRLFARFAGAARPRALAARLLFGAAAAFFAGLAATAAFFVGAFAPAAAAAPAPAPP